MSLGVLGYLGSKNIGDFIQTKAVLDLVNSKNIKYIDRENLHLYNGKVIKTIINGWFLEDPDNWPPSKKIIPLFISFHITPAVKYKLLQKQSLEYFKDHEPIGCRDFYTRDILLENGINAFFSSCVTTSIERDKYLKKSIPEGIIVVGPFDRLKPNLDYKSIFKLLISILKFPVKAINYNLKLKKFNKYLRKQKQSVKVFDQITDHEIKSHTEGLRFANEMLEKIAESEIMITSRIHAALPAVAMGLKVIFIDEGLEHENHRQRLSGLKNYFTNVNLKEFLMLNLDDIQLMKNHKPYIQKNKDLIAKFLNQ